MSSTRSSKLAGSWYSESADVLKNSFQEVINKDIVNEEKSSFVLAPHAGHRFCLPQILTSLKHLDIQPNTKNIIVIGPSHKVAFKNKFYMSPFKQVHTPMGNLTVDHQKIHQLNKSLPKFLEIATQSMDQNEHCLEIIYPALKYLIDFYQKEDIQIVPMIVSKFDTENLAKEVINHIFENGLEPKETKVVVSSDFTHWGSPYDYFFKIDSMRNFNKYITKDNVEVELDTNKSINLLNLASMLVLSSEKKISSLVYKNMEMPQLLDAQPIVRNGTIIYNFRIYLRDTEDTICGMHPIMFVLSIIDDEKLRTAFNLLPNASFKFVDYGYSSKVQELSDYRVSYVSGYISN